MGVSARTYQQQKCQEEGLEVEECRLARNLAMNIEEYTGNFYHSVLVHGLLATVHDFCGLRYLISLKSKKTLETLSSL